jgi:hypothetical protein
MFSITLAGRDHLNELLDAVADQVLRYVGRTSPERDALVIQLHTVASRAIAKGDSCDVEFRAHGGTCDVVAVAGDQEVWRISCKVTSTSTS